MKQPSGHSDDPIEDATALDLVVPWHLPSDLDLGEREREAVAATLAELDAELAAECPRAAALVKLLERFPTPRVQEHTILETKSNLESEEVRAYDRFFEVRHVDTPSPAFSLVRSLLTTCHAFLELRETGADFDPRHVALQTEGFREHARVLARICGLEPEA
ncbi:MAG: hypothetical protein AAGC67_03225 [Myxococcota bacterium]